MMWCHFALLISASVLLWTEVVSFDEYLTCPSRPHGHARMHQDPPCDFSKKSYCEVPGSAYPWRAVRSFVVENQALMRRMYGDVRQITVLRAELDSNDIAAFGYADMTRSPTDEIVPDRRHPVRQHTTPTSTSTSASTSTTTTTTTTTTTSTTSTTTAPPTTVPLTTLEQLHEDEMDLFAHEALDEMSPTTSPTTSGITTGVDDLPISTTLTDKSTSKERIGIPPPALFQDSTTETTSEQAPPVIPVRGINACPVKEEVVAPYWANNTRGEMLALLNLYPFEQYVHWEKCTNENYQMYCREGCRCEQQYRLHRLLAFDVNNQCRGIFSDWFRFPSCCVCKCYNIPAEFRYSSSRTPRVRGIDIPTRETPRKMSDDVGEAGRVQSVTDKADYVKGSASRVETTTLGTLDTATPHYYRYSYPYLLIKMKNGSMPFPLNRSPRHVRN